MSAFEALEMDVVVKLKIVTYYPSNVIERQVEINRRLNEAMEDVGKQLSFLASPASVTIMQGKNT
jgi:hypothetical protein